jgi:hypothetical protein
LSRPGSASIRQRRPSITLDKIPESVNERRPDSNRRDGEFSPGGSQKKGYNGSFSDAKSLSTRSSLDEEDEEEGGSAPRNSQMMRISSSDERMLNVNIAEPNCDCTDIVSSSYYTPIIPAYVPFRDDASRAMSKGQVQQYYNTKGNLVRWVCTGLTPQLLELQLTESFQIRSVDIECYGEVEEMLLHMTESNVSCHVTTLECRRKLTSGPSSSFSVDVSSQIDASSHILQSPSDICDKVFLHSYKHRHPTLTVCLCLRFISSVDFFHNNEVGGGFLWNSQADDLWVADVLVAINQSVLGRFSGLIPCYAVNIDYTMRFVFAYDCYLSTIEHIFSF